MANCLTEFSRVWAYNPEYEHSETVEDMTIPTAFLVRMVPLKYYMPKLALLLAVFGLRQVGSGYAFHFGGCRRFAKQFGRYARVFFRCSHYRSSPFGTRKYNIHLKGEKVN